MSWNADVTIKHLIYDITLVLILCGVDAYTRARNSIVIIDVSNCY
jgi:hypothetical protein